MDTETKYMNYNIVLPMNHNHLLLDWQLALNAIQGLILSEDIKLQERVIKYLYKVEDQLPVESDVMQMEV